MKMNKFEIGDEVIMVKDIFETPTSIVPIGTKGKITGIQTKIITEKESDSHNLYVVKWYDHFTELGSPLISMYRSEYLQSNPKKKVNNDDNSRTIH